jgi:hypothetical protein
MGLCWSGPGHLLTLRNNQMQDINKKPAQPAEPVAFEFNSSISISDTKTGEVIRETKNAVHPQNMARVIARALANEDNHHIYRMAFGNGGTRVDASELITYYPPHDGQAPDPNTYNSTMYNQTYYEVIDDQSPLISTGPGAVPANDPPSVPYISGPGCRSIESGLISKVVCECVLNSSEPTSEYLTDVLGTPGYPESSFTFDEISLYSTGAPQLATAGYQDVDVGVKYSTSETGLLPSTEYTLSIAVDGGTTVPIAFNTPAVGAGVGGVITYADVISTINGILSAYGAFASISDGAVITYGYLRFSSMTSGAASSIVVTDTGVRPLMSNLGGFVQIVQPVAGKNSGVQNAPSDPSTEVERMLTHAVFAPIVKTANRSFTIRYVLTISVARSRSPQLTN